jgi:hypothetical protein
LCEYDGAWRKFAPDTMDWNDEDEKAWGEGKQSAAAE